MALATRVVLAVVLGILTGCASSQPSVRAAFAAGPERPGLERVLVLTPDSDTHADVVSSLRQEIDADFQSVVQVLAESSSVDDITRVIQRVDPTCVILLDNRTVELYRQAVIENPSAGRPAIILMASYLRDVYLRRVPDSTGISYEIPAVSVYLRLRSITRQSMSKVGVLYRPSFESYINRQAAMARLEGIVFETIQTPEHPSPDDVRANVKTLLSKGVESIWVLNDNRLLSPELLLDGWTPAVDGTDIAVVVGVDSLISTVKLGNFAMLPNHAQLGMQAADMLYRLEESKWRVDRVPPEEPFGVEPVLRLDAQSDADKNRDQAQATDRADGRWAR